MPERNCISIEFAGHALELLPDRAIWWPARQTLIVADVHLGKGAAFRNAGLPVPAGSSAKDLHRLAELMSATAAQRLVVLGDFIHGRASHQQEIHRAIANWRATHNRVEILLVRGNHDRSAGRLLTEWNISEIEEPMDDSGIVFSHEPRQVHGAPVLSGHLHPTFGVEDFDGSSVAFPCFVFDDRCAVLPAFGSFTGGHRIGRQPARRIFVTSGKRVSRIDCGPAALHPAAG